MLYLGPIKGPSNFHEAESTAQRLVASTGENFLVSWHSDNSKTLRGSDFVVTQLVSLVIPKVCFHEMGQ